MATFLELQDAVAVETVFRARAAETQFAPQIRLHINEAIREYENTRFWFNEQLWTQDTEAEKEFYALPREYVRMLTLSIFSPRRELDGVSLPEIEALAPAYGIPSRYATFASQYRLYPIPDAAYQLRLWGVRRFDPLVDDGASNPWTTDAYDLTIEAAKARIFSRVLHQDEDAAKCAVAAEDALRRLERQTDRRLPSTSIPGYL